MDFHSIGSNDEIVAARYFKKLGVDPAVSQRVTIGSLPDNVLLEIFDFYLEKIWDWETLVHVCRRWRYIIFGSPIRLNLRLLCTRGTPVRKLLNVWPEFPLAIKGYSKFLEDIPKDRLHNLIAALEHRNRVREIVIASHAGRLLQGIGTTMDEPFPALKSLDIDTLYREYVLHDGFLNGSAPCLRDLTLRGVSFPSLPQLLSSTSDLTSLHLIDIPTSGYISPETMSGCLSALPKLKSLIINFISPTPEPRRVPPPPTRFVLPALTKLAFKGVSEYLEGLAARMDAPLLDEFVITFFHQHVFDIPQIIRFFGDSKSFRSSSLALGFDRFKLGPYDPDVSIFFSPSTCYSPNRHSWCIKCERLDLRVVSLAQICDQILHFRSSVDTLIIRFGGLPSLQDHDVDPTLWLQLFHSFPSVRSLRLSATLVPFIAPALQGLTGESAAEVFPSLRSILVDPGSYVAGLPSFIAARQESGHPVALVH